MPAVGDRDIAQRHIVTKLKGDDFVAACAAAASERLSGNPPAADDGDVFEALAPNQGVMKVAVAGILELIPLIRLRRIVSRGFGTGLDHRPAFEPQRDIAAQAHRSRDPGTGGEFDRPATGRGRGFDGFADSFPVLRLAIALRAEGRDIEHGRVERKGACE